MDNEHKISPPTVILVKPQMGENIGASARAMLNCGLDDMRLISPRDGWPNERAVANAAGAFDIMEQPQVFDDTSDAISDCNYVYATTARPRDMVKPVFTAQSAAQDMIARSLEGQKIAILFGGERAGLDNEDVSRSDAIITIPLNPDFSSLNLAQGVLICAYEWSSRVYDAPERALPQGDSAPVDKAKFEELMERLEHELEVHQFFRNPDMKPTMMRNIRNLYSRAEMTDQEVRTFQGVISALIGNKTR